MSDKVIVGRKYGFKDLLIVPQRSELKSRSEVDLVREFKFKHSPHKWSGVPIVAANMDTVGTFEVALELMNHKMLTALHKHYSVEDFDNFILTLDQKSKESFFEYSMISTGTSDSDRERTEILLKKYPFKFVCIDVANGYSQYFSNFVKTFRENNPDPIIFAGNVVTEEMTHQLLVDGADIVKVGIGPGSVCTTRKQTGVGYPQMSAILECSSKAHRTGGGICADGGCTIPGDVAKAFGGNADFVMLGGMLAGHLQSGGARLQIDGKEFIEFYGMSSKAAMDKHSGGVAEYRSSEGKRVLLPFKGDINNTILDLLGGIRSTCTYVGAKSIKELGKNVVFIEVNEQLNEIYGKS